LYLKFHQEHTLTTYTSDISTSVLEVYQNPRENLLTIL